MTGEAVVKGSRQANYTATATWQITLLMAFPAGVTNSSSC